MFKNLKKITIKSNENHGKVLTAQRSQCRTTHKRKDC